MKEYMFYIRNTHQAKEVMTADEHLHFVKSCEEYIMKLRTDNKLIAAQPLVSEGVVLNKMDGDWKIEILDTSSQVQVGYYHIIASDIDEAIDMAKGNPEFRFVPSASIEIHEIKTKETSTSFVYPNALIR